MLWNKSGLKVLKELLVTFVLVSYLPEIVSETSCIYEIHCHRMGTKSGKIYVTRIGRTNIQHNRLRQAVLWFSVVLKYPQLQHNYSINSTDFITSLYYCYGNSRLILLNNFSLY